METNSIQYFISQFVSPENRLFIPYLLTSFIFFYIFKKFKLPHIAKDKQSFEQDIILFLLTIFCFYLINTYVFNYIRALIPMLLPEDSSKIVFLKNNDFMRLFFSLGYILVYDLALFINHYISHKIQALWNYHKVHHSAKSLHVLTALRFHPIDAFLTKLFVLTFVLLYSFLMEFSFGLEFRSFEVAGVSIFVVLFYALGYHLRHSHTYLCYPRFLSLFFISPAAHQIHHSDQVVHKDKNFGFIFSFWDRIFSTYYDPKIEIENKSLVNLRFGLIEKNNSNLSLWEMLKSPILIRNRFNLYFFIAILLLVLVTPNSTAPIDPKNKNLLIENQTWRELQENIKQGYDRIIIPTGGFEQNGPYLTLDKHQVVVGYTSLEIAERLGKTLVAPVVRFSPQSLEHLNFTGTLAAEEDVYERQLMGIGEQLIKNGFNNLFFLGDSLHGQIGLEKVVQLLKDKYPNKNLIYVKSYYYYNKVKILEQKGYSQLEIGDHAGMLETSEVLHINKALVRHHSTKPKRMADFSGEPTLANANLGKVLLEDKINNALVEIRSGLKD